MSLSVRERFREREKLSHDDERFVGNSAGIGYEKYDEGYQREPSEADRSCRIAPKPAVACRK